MEKESSRGEEDGGQEEEERKRGEEKNEEERKRKKDDCKVDPDKRAKGTATDKGITMKNEKRIIDEREGKKERLVMEIQI